MSKPGAPPTKLELAILRVLWAAGPRSVREIQTTLNASKPIGYTTVLKMLQLMTDKGLVERDETRRPQIYRPTYSQAQTQKQLLRDFLERAYGGSVKTLVLHAVGTRRPSPKDVELLETLLERFEGDKP